MTNLQWLYLHGNQLTGTIPAELESLTNLQRLYLHGNELTGPIPSWLVNLTELLELSLWSNQLTGTIPLEVAPAQDLAALLVLYGRPAARTGRTAPTGAPTSRFQNGTVYPRMPKAASMN